MSASPSAASHQPANELPPIPVGGQAVLEGVMMRSPRSLVVVCRRPDQAIALKEAPWISVWDWLKFLRWPVLRGGVIFWETLQNGLHALSFSAQQQALVEEDGQGQASGGLQGDSLPAARAAAPPPEGSKILSAILLTPLLAATAEVGEPRRADPPLSSSAITGTIIFSMLLAFLLFAALPHLLTFLTGLLTGTPLDGKSFAFHAIDGVFKLIILLGYMLAISRMKEIQRVFMYHGAEHKSIFTYEAGEPLTVENARKYTTYHPRCGTSFLLLVILVSILIFTLAFSGPWMPEFFPNNRWLNQLTYVFIKLPLMFPIAGVAYEFLKISGKSPRNWLLRPIIAPGLWMQRITTREPTDDQLEVALLSLRKVLWRERLLATEPSGTHDRTAGPIGGEVEVFAAASEVELPLFGRRAVAASPEQ